MYKQKGRQIIQKKEIPEPQILHSVHRDVQMRNSRLRPMSWYVRMTGRLPLGVPLKVT